LYIYYLYAMQKGSSVATFRVQSCCCSSYSVCVVLNPFYL